MRMITHLLLICCLPVNCLLHPLEKWTHPHYSGHARTYREEANNNYKNNNYPHNTLPTHYNKREEYALNSRRALFMSGRNKPLRTTVPRIRNEKRDIDLLNKIAAIFNSVRSNRELTIDFNDSSKGADLDKPKDDKHIHATDMVENLTHSDVLKQERHINESISLDNTNASRKISEQNYQVRAQQKIPVLSVESSSQKSPNTEIPANDRSFNDKYGTTKNQGLDRRFQTRAPVYRQAMVSSNNQQNIKHLKTTVKVPVAETEDGNSRLQDLIKFLSNITHPATEMENSFPTNATIHLQASPADLEEIIIDDNALRTWTKKYSGQPTLVYQDLAAKHSQREIQSESPLFQGNLNHEITAKLQHLSNTTLNAEKTENPPNETAPFYGHAITIKTDRRYIKTNHNSERSQLEGTGKDALSYKDLNTEYAYPLNHNVAQVSRQNKHETLTKEIDRLSHGSESPQLRIVKSVFWNRHISPNKNVKIQRSVVNVYQSKSEILTTKTAVTRTEGENYIKSTEWNKVVKFKRENNSDIPVASFKINNITSQHRRDYNASDTNDMLDTETDTTESGTDDTDVDTDTDNSVTGTDNVQQNSNSADESKADKDSDKSKRKSRNLIAQNHQHDGYLDNSRTNDEESTEEYWVAKGNRDVSSMNSDLSEQGFQQKRDDEDSDDEQVSTNIAEDEDVASSDDEGGAGGKREYSFSGKNSSIITDNTQAEAKPNREFSKYRPKFRQTAENDGQHYFTVQAPLTPSYFNFKSQIQRPNFRKNAFESHNLPVKQETNRKITNETKKYGLKIHPQVNMVLPPFSAESKNSANKRISGIKYERTSAPVNYLQSDIDQSNNIGNNNRYGYFPNNGDQRKKASEKLNNNNRETIKDIAFVMKPLDVEYESSTSEYSYKSIPKANRNPVREATNQNTNGIDSTNKMDHKYWKDSKDFQPSGETLDLQLESPPKEKFHNGDLDNNRNQVQKAMYPNSNKNVHYERNAGTNIDNKTARNGYIKPKTPLDGNNPILIDSRQSSISETSQAENVPKSDSEYSLQKLKSMINMFEETTQNIQNPQGGIVKGKLRNIETGKFGRQSSIFSNGSDQYISSREVDKTSGELKYNRQKLNIENNHTRTGSKRNDPAKNFEDGKFYSRDRYDTVDGRHDSAKNVYKTNKVETTGNLHEDKNYRKQLYQPSMQNSDYDDNKFKGNLEPDLTTAVSLFVTIAKLDPEILLPVEKYKFSRTSNGKRFDGTYLPENIYFSLQEKGLKNLMLESSKREDSSSTRIPDEALKNLALESFKREEISNTKILEQALKDLLLGNSKREDSSSTRIPEEALKNLALDSSKREDISGTKIYEEALKNLVLENSKREDSSSTIVSEEDSKNFMLENSKREDNSSPSIPEVFLNNIELESFKREEISSFSKPEEALEDIMLESFEREDSSSPRVTEIVLKDPMIDSSKREDSSSSIIPEEALKDLMLESLKTEDSSIPRIPKENVKDLISESPKREKNDNLQMPREKWNSLVQNQPESIRSNNEKLEETAQDDMRPMGQVKNEKEYYDKKQTELYPQISNPHKIKESQIKRQQIREGSKLFKKPDINSFLPDDIRKYINPGSNLNIEGQRKVAQKSYLQRNTAQIPTAKGIYNQNETMISNIYSNDNELNDENYLNKKQHKMQQGDQHNKQRLYRKRTHYIPNKFYQTKKIGSQQYKRSAHQGDTFLFEMGTDKSFVGNRQPLNHGEYLPYGHNSLMSVNLAQSDANIPQSQNEELMKYEGNINLEGKDTILEPDRKISSVIEELKSKKTILQDTNEIQETNVVEQGKKKIMDKIMYLQESTSVEVLPDIEQEFPEDYEPSFEPLPVNPFVNEEIPDLSGLEKEWEYENQSPDEQKSNVALQNIDKDVYLRVSQDTMTTPIVGEESYQMENAIEGSKKKNLVCYPNISSYVEAAKYPIFNDGTKNIAFEEETLNESIPVTSEEHIDPGVYRLYQQSLSNVTNMFVLEPLVTAEIDEVGTEPEFEFGNILPSYAPSELEPSSEAAAIAQAIKILNSGGTKSKYSEMESEIKDSNHENLNLGERHHQNQKYPLIQDNANKHFQDGVEVNTAEGVKAPKVMEKEEIIEKKSSTVIENKDFARNETARLLDTRKTKIANNKEIFHQTLVQEKEGRNYTEDYENNKGNPDDQHIEGEEQNQRPVGESHETEKRHTLVKPVIPDNLKFMGPAGKLPEKYFKINENESDKDVAQQLSQENIYENGSQLYDVYDFQEGEVSDSENLVKLLNPNREWRLNSMPQIHRIPGKGSRMVYQMPEMKNQFYNNQYEPNSFSEEPKFRYPHQNSENINPINMYNLQFKKGKPREQGIPLAYLPKNKFHGGGFIRKGNERIGPIKSGHGIPFMLQPDPIQINPKRPYVQHHGKPMLVAINALKHDGGKLTTPEPQIKNFPMGVGNVVHVTLKSTTNTQDVQNDNVHIEQKKRAAVFHRQRHRVPLASSLVKSSQINNQR